jgi:hypothetical protein
LDCEVHIAVGLSEEAVILLKFRIKYASIINTITLYRRIVRFDLCLAFIRNNTQISTKPSKLGNSHDSAVETEYCLTVNCHKHCSQLPVSVAGGQRRRSVAARLLR